MPAISTRARTSLAAAVGAVLLLGATTACDVVAALDGGVPGDAPAPTLVREGVLTVCTDMPYEPFEFEEAGKPAGFDVDLVQLVADRLTALGFDVGGFQAPAPNALFEYLRGLTTTVERIAAFTVATRGARSIIAISPEYEPAGT